MQKLLLALVLAVTSQASFSYTQCEVEVDRMWLGDEGWMWLHYTNGGSAKIHQNTDTDFKNILSATMTALTTGNSMIVRYDADNVNCAEAGRGDVRGVYLYGRKL